MVYRDALETRRLERVRGFESYRLRQNIVRPTVIGYPPPTGG